MLSLFGFGEIFRCHFEETKGDRAVVALDEDMVFRGKAFALGGAGGAIDDDVLLDELPIEVDGEKVGLFEDGAVFGEAGSAEFDDECLPLAGGVGCVDFGGMSFVALRAAIVVPAVVCSHVAIGGLCLAVAGRGFFS